MATKPVSAIETPRLTPALQLALSRIQLGLEPTQQAARKLESLGLARYRRDGFRVTDRARGRLYEAYGHYELTPAGWTAYAVRVGVNMARIWRRGDREWPGKRTADDVFRIARAVAIAAAMTAAGVKP